MVAEVAANETLTTNAGEMQSKLAALQAVNQGLEVDLAVAKAAVVAQEGMMASMLQRLSATIPDAESGAASSSA